MYKQSKYWDHRDSLEKIISRNKQCLIQSEDSKDWDDADCSEKSVLVDFDGQTHTILKFSQDGWQYTGDISKPLGTEVMWTVDAMNLVEADFKA